MIKFFRKIRQKLLSENKLSKYLIYAIGEIILVVIGILIALQLNSWNENKVLRQKERDYLTDMHSFLEMDRENLIQLNSFYKRKKQVYDSTLTYFDSKYTTKDIGRLFIPYMRSTDAYKVFEINSTAFDNMMSANDINIISNKLLRHKLYSYYSQNTLLGIQERVKKATREFRDYLTENFTTKEGLDNFFNINSLAPSESDLADIRTSSEFYKLYFNTGNSIANQINYLESQLNYINELIELIDKFNYSIK